MESTPKNPLDESYSKIISYVGKKTNVPVKIRMFDLKGKEIKILTVKKLKKIDGRWVAMESLMQNLQEKSSTKLIIQKISFKEKIDDEVFTRRYLKRG